MRLRQTQRRWWLSTVLLCCSATGLTAPPEAAPKPSARIPVEPLGFVPPPRLFVGYRVPSATLGFLDADHLLFTFHVAKLMRREPDDPKDDQDQTVRAVVLALPGGRVESEGTWRLHDKGPYLWNLRNGSFLMRQRDTLYIGDKRLVLQPYLHSEGQLAAVQLSPDAGTLLAQYAKPMEGTDEEGDRAGNIPTLGDDAPRFPEKAKQYTMLVVDTDARKVRREGRVPHPVSLPLLGDGYLDVEQAKGKQWRVLQSAFGGDKHPVATVTSTCEPKLQTISQDAFLTLSCLPTSSDHLVEAFDAGGKKLWEQVWQSRFTWGSFAYSAVGNRFVYATVEVNHELATLDPVDADSIVGQPIGTFQIASGKLDAVLDASPILTAGGNFALSPDGNTLAILRGGAIELYTLPPVAPPRPRP